MFYSEEKEKRYRKAKVRLSLFQDDEYGEISMKVLKFIELKDDATDNEDDQAEVAAKQEEIAKFEKSTIKVRPGEGKITIKTPFSLW